MEDGDGLIEIDPELYMKCRLCIEAKGKFQIPPKLQEKIKYAFDIDVHLFDGFSQIICERCRTIVSDYCDVKEQFQGKQKELLTNASALLPQQANTENGESFINRSDIRGDSHSEENKSRKKKTKKVRKKVVYSTSSSDEDFVQPSSPADKDKTSDKSVNSPNTPLVIEVSEPDTTLTANWKDLYKRSYVCRYCDKKLTFKNSMKDHVRFHENLRRKNRKLTKWNSTVQIERFEDHPNLTGNNDVVVVGPSQLITEVNNPDFYVVYTPASLHTNLQSTYISSDSKDMTSDSEDNDVNTKKRFTCVDVMSDGDEQTHRPKLRKRIRLQSTLSVDTIDLQADTSEVPNEGFSNTLSQHIFKGTDSEAVTKTKTQTHCSDYDTIKQTIYVSLQIENKKRQMDERPKIMNADDILKRKLLSIGRKVMYKQGYSSMGLLKYLEQRNLKLQWTDPTKKANTNLSGKDSTYVRIQTRLSESRESSNLSWFELNSFVPCKDTFNPHNETITERKLHVSSNTDDKTNMFEKEIVESVKLTPIVKNTPLSVGPQVSSNTQALLPPKNIPFLPATSLPLLPALPNTTLIKTSDLTPISVTSQPSDTAKYTQFLKVLNASPVANPKKAIKKIKTNETIGSQIQQNNTLVSTNVSTDHNYISNFICLDSDEEDHPHKAPVPASTLNETTSVQPQVNLSYVPADPVQSASHIITNSQGLCMPIITSTESLANIIKEGPRKGRVEQSNEIKVPRIKCKPVSELMAGKDEQVVQLQGQLNKSLNNSIQLSNGNLEIVPLKSQKAQKAQKINTKKIPPDFIVLHTTTLPYTITDKPFEYFGKLLRMQMLFLIDSCGPPDFDYVKLVKFKLGVQQYPVSVMLYLSLESYGSSFRIIVKNKNDEDINVHTMLALWQWEVLKAFNQPSVIAKVKQAAEKAQAANIAFTNLFLSILGSIKLVSVSEGHSFDYNQRVIHDPSINL